MQNKSYMSEDRYRFLVEMTSDWIWEVDTRGIYTYASPKVKDILGYEPDEIVGKRAFDLMPPDEGERIGEIYANYVARAESFSLLDNINVHKDGRHVILQTSGVPIKDDQGKLVGYRGIDRDITLLKAAEESLKQSEKQYRFTIDALADLMHVINPDYRIVLVNQTFKIWCDEYGINSDALGKTVVEVFDFLSEHVHDEYKRVFETGEIVYSEDVTRFQDRVVYTETRKIPIIVEGKAIQIVTVVRDITQRKLAEQQIQDYQQKLKALTRELEHVKEQERQEIATKLHENLGQMLAVSNMKLQQVMQNIDASTPIHQSVQNALDLNEQSIQYIRSIIYELSNPILTNLGLKVALESELEQVRMMHHIDMDLTFEIGSIQLSNELERFIYHSVREMISNVIKHAHADQVNVIVEIDNPLLRVCVSDNGIGFQTKDDSVRNVSSGFGLFRIREQLDVYNGNMIVKSKPGKETSVLIEIPLDGIH